MKMAAKESVPSLVRELISSFMHQDSLEDELSTCHEKTSVSVDENRTSPAGSIFPSQPRNREAFLKRLDTYSTLTWFAKPNFLSPLYCATYGWINIDKDLLKCVSCKAVLSATLPKTTDSIIYEDSCQKLEDCITTSHKSMCPWLNNHTPESYSTIQFNSREAAVAQVRKTYTALQQLHGSLPQLSSEIITDEHTVTGLIKAVSSGIGDHSENDAESKISIQLAVTGWDYRCSTNNILQCNFCRRSVGLWNYLTVKEAFSLDINGQENDSGPPSKKQKTLKSKFCPLSEHRTWCPWVNATPKDSTDNDLPRWKSLLVFLSQEGGTLQTNYEHLQKESPVHESLRKVRKILKDWSSPS